MTARQENHEETEHPHQVVFAVINNVITDLERDDPGEKQECVQSGQQADEQPGGTDYRQRPANMNCGGSLRRVSQNGKRIRMDQLQRGIEWQDTRVGVKAVEVRIQRRKVN